MKLKFINQKLKRLGLALAIAFLILLIVIRLTTAPNHLPVESRSIKGVWLTHVGNAALTYTSRTDDVFHQLSRLNYNRVYVDVYNDGVTYPSRYAPRNYLLSLPLTNPLTTAIREGKRQGLKIYAWYEHGMMTFGNSQLAQQHPDWILTTKDNQKLIDNHWWLDPANPEVQQYFINLFTEVAANYPELYGIQVDDHWGIPIQFGNKSEAMTDLTHKIVQAIRNTNPKLIISLSPNPLGFSIKKYSQNWLAWIKMGLIDELVMQLYRPTSQQVALSIDNSILPEASRYLDVSVGIYAGSFKKQKPLAEIKNQIDTVKAYGYGYAIFPWETSLGWLRWHLPKVKESYLK